MLEWLTRGLSRSAVTMRYPRTPARPPAGYAGPVVVKDVEGAPESFEDLCPTGAIAVVADRLGVDRGRCIGCGECVRRAPTWFAFDERYETARGARSDLVVGQVGIADDMRHPARALGDRALGLRRSIHIRHVDTGSDGAEEWEIHALWNPVYDIQRLGFFLTSSPRHADILLVTGGVCHPMREPLERAWDAMPSPKAVVAVGTDACSGGLASDTGQTSGGVDAVLPVDVYVPGSPPAPIAILDGLLLAVGQRTALEADERV